MRSSQIPRDHRTVAKVDLERSRLLNEADDLAVKSLKAVAKAVIEKAKAGDKTCAELFFKYLANPVRQEHRERIARTPQPTPLVIQRALMTIRTNIGLPPEGEAKELTDGSAQQPESGGMKLLPSPAPTTASASPDPAPEPNRTCPCGQEFHSNQPRAKWCECCKKERSMARLMANKQKRPV